MSSPRRGQKPRLRLDSHMIVPRFTEEEIAEIDRAMELMGLRSRTAVVRKATMFLIEDLRRASE